MRGRAGALNSTLAAIVAPPAPVPKPPKPETYAMAVFGLFTLSIDPESESEDEEEVPPFRTVYDWGEEFTVHQKDRVAHEEDWGGTHSGAGR